MPSPPLLRPRPETDEEENTDPAEEDDEGAVWIVGAADVETETIIATKKKCSHVRASAARTNDSRQLRHLKCSRK